MRRKRWAAIRRWITAVCLLAAAVGSADEIELANGKKLQGKVLEQAKDFITFDSGGTKVRFPAASVKSVRIDPAGAAPTPSPTPAPAAPEPESPEPPEPTPTPRPLPAKRTPSPHSPHAALPAIAATTPSLASAKAPAPVAVASKISRTEIDALIAKAGATPPDWWDSVALNYPPTLDLRWTPPANKEWNAQKNLGQFMWEIINPNPPRWRDGVKLLHHVLTVNQSDREKLTQTAEQLAHKYHYLLQDWPRAAFWWRKTAQLGGWDIEDFALELAECYWKMGSKEMAVQALSAMPYDDTRDGSLIKLWSDMGELDRALRLAEQKARSGGMPYIAYLVAGDACRLAGRHADALNYYQRVLAVRYDPKMQFAGFVKRCQDRARASIEAVRLFDTLDLGKIPDGAYRSVSPGYAGPMHIEVVVKAGRIESVKVVRHQEKQFYSAIADATGQIIAKQSVKGIDMTSGATITAEAIVNATAKALAGGMEN